MLFRGLLYKVVPHGQFRGFAARTGLQQGKKGLYLMYKIKKILSSVLAAASAAVIAVSSFSAVSFAETTTAASNSDATFCFDNTSSLPMWTFYGPTDETGFKLSVNNDVKESGDGALCINETVRKDIPADEQYGGAYITADQVGLESFAGCTFQVSACFEADAAKKATEFKIFSDGIVWIESSVSSNTDGRWSKVSLTVPDTAKNEKLGFSIPLYSEYDGKVAYIDNIIIYNADGTQVANVGDFAAAKDRAPVSIGKGGRIVLIIVLVIIIASLLGGAFFFIKTRMKRYR